MPELELEPRRMLEPHGRKPCVLARLPLLPAAHINRQAALPNINVDAALDARSHLPVSDAPPDTPKPVAADDHPEAETEDAQERRVEFDNHFKVLQVLREL